MKATLVYGDLYRSSNSYPEPGTLSSSVIVVALILGLILLAFSGTLYVMTKKRIDEW